MECSICLDSIHDLNDSVKLKCSHYFHLECINRWFTKSKSCPYCRTIIDNKYKIYFTKYKFFINSNNFVVSKLQELEIIKRSIILKNENMIIPINKIKTMSLKNYIIELKVLIGDKLVSRFIKGESKTDSYNIYEHLRNLFLSS